MKLYEFRRAPNPRRVRVFLKEKGLDVPMEQVDLFKGEHKKPEYLKRNPSGLVPTLELDDGRHIAETVAICRYLEEMHPNPPLMGTDAFDKATVEMWQRRVELELLMPIAHCFRHTVEAVKPLEPQQVKEWGELNRGRALASMRRFDKELAGREFMAGPRFTIADITALCAIDFGKAAGIAIPDDCANLKRWHQAVSARPSAAA
jgi:glutathione S-transferase